MGWVWSDNDPVAPPTDEWHKLNLLQHNIVPLANEDLFGEDNSIHEQARLIKKLIPLPPRKSHSVEDWLTIFGKAFDDDTQLSRSSNGAKFRNLAIRMAVTNPRLLFEADIWDGTELRSRHDTVIWKAAYEFMGAPWNKKEQKTTKKRSIEDDSDATQTTET